MSVRAQSTARTSGTAGMAGLARVRRASLIALVLVVTEYVIGVLWQAVRGRRPAVIAWSAAGSVRAGLGHGGGAGAHS